jgi:hypothetical protein
MASSDLVAVGIGDPGCVSGSSCPQDDDTEIAEGARFSSKSDARTRAHSESWRKIELALPMDFVRSALECDAFPHRFQSISEEAATRPCAETKLALAKTRDDNARVAE